MSERYYVVSESELEALREAAYNTANAHPARVDEIRHWQKKEDDAEAACRARPVEPLPPEPDCYLWKEKR